MIMGELIWTPPASMETLVARGWRAFYGRILETYGVYPADYRDMYLAQMGCCYICRMAKGIHPDDPKGRGSRRLGVDHNHALGNNRRAVRGLLCSGGDRTCNRIIGWLNHAQLQRAVEYMECPPGPRVREAGLYADSVGLTGENRDLFVKSILGIK